MSLDQIAEIIGTEGFEAHRGVIHYYGGDFLLFGNDGYNSDDGRAKQEVAAVREHIAGRADELAMGYTEDGYTWVMLVRFREGFDTEAGREMCRSLLTAAMWRRWIGSGEPPDRGAFEHFQGAHAETAIDRIREQVLDVLEEGY
jgi:hypothetical protein